MNRLLGPLPSTSEAVKSAIEAQRTKELLSIESRNLNPNNELKRIFGVKIVQSEQRYANYIFYIMHTNLETLMLNMSSHFKEKVQDEDSPA